MFDPMNPNTWKKNGISSRWGTHRTEEYGKDGMIVLTAITKEAVLHRHQGSLLHQEQYTLALEQILQHHYKLKKNDPRFANNTFTSGGTDGSKSIAYAVYIAFSLSDHDEETTMEGGSNPQQLEDCIMNNPSQTSSQELNVMSTSKSLFSPTKVSRKKRPRMGPHPPATKRRHQESGQDATNDISPIQDELLTDQQKMIRVVELLFEELKAVKKNSKGIEQNPNRTQGSQTTHANTSTSAAGSKRTKTKKKQHSTTTTTKQTAHTDRPQGSQTTDASTSTSAAGSRQTKTQKRVHFAKP